MSPEPFVSCAKAPPAKRSEKGYGDENGEKSIACSQFFFRSSITTTKLTNEENRDKII